MRSWATTSAAAAALIGGLFSLGARAQAPSGRADSRYDIVQLLPRGSVQGRVLGFEDGELKMRVIVGGGAGSADRDIPLGRVKWIDFAPLPGEAELLAAGGQAPRAALVELWSQRRPQLPYAASNAGEIGLVLGSLLLASDDPADHANARNLFTIVERDDWDEARRARAKRGRLEAMVKLGAAAEVLAEAAEIAESGDTPDLLLTAEYLLASADLAKLRTLVAENPKWREDEHIRPEVEALYHDLLDRFLKPFLFYGTEAEHATQGLLAAGEIYYLLERPEQARECFEDIRLLYPEAGDALIEAEAFLLRLSQNKPYPDHDDATNPVPEE